MPSFIKKVEEKVDEDFKKIEKKIHDKFHKLVHRDHKHKHDTAGPSAARSTEHAEDQPVLGLVKHRFDSSFPQTTGHTKWYVDGCSYFWALSEALESATSTIYILDWWLSPELYLRRPPAANEQYRLDRMLKAAANRGVQVRVIVYNEVKQALSLDSEHTKKALEALSHNIQVFRHPDHSPDESNVSADLNSSFKDMRLRDFDLAKFSKDALKALYGQYDDTVLYWAHHEKLCIVDNKIAFMGGLDACFGRWDTNSHPIADAHPGDLNAIIFPGQDYNNARVYDFAGVDRWEQNKLDRRVSSRMGWSDVSISLSGHIVNSLVYHFVDRWNYVYDEKYNFEKTKYARLLAPGPKGQLRLEDLKDSAVQYPFSGIHTHFTDRMRRMVEGNQMTASREDRVHIQLVRSSSPWSSGHPVEHSVQNAYIDVIKKSQHFIYIENQFFITATSPKQNLIKNQIGAAIVERIIRARREGQLFRVIVCMPAVPAFAGDLKGDAALGTRAIMMYQYNSISRGSHSIFAKLREAGVEDPTRYISFYNLRNFDRINSGQAMRQAEQESGVSYEAARTDFEDGLQAPIDASSVTTDTNSHSQSPAKQFQSVTSNTSTTFDSVTSTYMLSGPPLSSLPFPGPPSDECNAFVSEELYIHSKILIADDRIAIIGSANLNDRSQLGTRDSEIAVVIEDPEPIETTMGGKVYTASRFATSLRRQIFRKHLGLLPDQKCDQPTQNWSPVTAAPNEYDWDSEPDRLVADPLSGEFEALWRDRAKMNTEVFSRVFHTVPNDCVRNWKDYEEWFEKVFVLPEPLKTDTGGPKQESKDKKREETDASEVERGTQSSTSRISPANAAVQQQLAPEEQVQEQEDQQPTAPWPTDGKTPYGHVVKSEFSGGLPELQAWLSRIKGSLVEMPLEFLTEEKDLAKSGLELNGLTEELYT